MAETAQRAPARVLIVDDSTVMRSLLRSVVGSDQRIEIAGTASNGESALRAMDSLHLDLVLLDVEMPVMDGLSTLKQMRLRGKRVPVIMCSSLTQRGAKVTIEALASGAADYVAKPSGQASREAAIRTLSQDLVPKILALTGSHPPLPPSILAAGPAAASPSGAGILPERLAEPLAGPVAGPLVRPAVGQGIRSVWPGTPASGSFGRPMGQEFKLQPISATHSVVVIGVSTGGPAALELLLPTLPANFPLPVLVVQHMPELFTKHLAERLDTRCPLRVREAVSGEPVHAGSIYIAKGNWHLEVHSASPARPDNAFLRLNQEAQENHCRPAVDVLFRSAAAVYGSGTLGVILTGMGSDGLAGSRHIRDRAGSVLAQDQATSVVWGMPGAVVQAGLAHRVLPLHAIASEILRLAGRSQREAFELRESAV